MDKALLDPLGEYIKSIRKSCRKRGIVMANDLCGDWDDGQIECMGEVFGNMLACGVIGAIGGSLYDVPMQ